MILWSLFHYLKLLRKNKLKLKVKFFCTIDILYENLNIYKMERSSEFIELEVLFMLFKLLLCITRY